MTKLRHYPCRFLQITFCDLGVRSARLTLVIGKDFGDYRLLLVSKEGRR